MEIETLRDVLHWTREFHRNLSQCLAHCADKNIDERARMLLSYLSEHEQTLSRIVGKFENSGNERALNTWCMEYIKKHPIERHVHCDEPFSKLNADEIMEVIVDQHQQVIELYQFLASRADIPETRELTSMLSSLEEHEAMRMLQSSNRFRDL